MPINGPRGAVPTSRGWENPKTGELLKSQRISQEQIDEWHVFHSEWHGITAPAPTPEPEPVVLTEAPMDVQDYNDMTKLELEAIGREHGIELDRRKSKDDLIDELEEHLAED